MAGNASPRGIHDLLLADPELINSTKAAWLGSSPDCRWEQERCGSRQCGRYQQEAQGKEAAGRCRGECGDREVTVMEPEFKKQNLRGFSEKLNSLVNLQEYLIDSTWTMRLHHLCSLKPRLGSFANLSMMHWDGIFCSANIIML